MFSPAYVLTVQPTNRPSISTHTMSEISKSPGLDTDGPLNNVRVSFHRPHNIPIRCYQSMPRPPPPHNNVARLQNNNNNNTSIKNYNKNSNTKRSTREDKNDKHISKHCNDEKEDIAHAECPKKSPENKGLKRLHEKNNGSQMQNIPQTFYTSNYPNDTFNHYFSFFAPHHQRNGYFNKQNYANLNHQNRPVNRNKRPLPVSPDGHGMLADILMDKFLARTSIVEIRNHPPKLLKGGEWDMLNSQIWDSFLTFQQTEEIYKKKVMLWKYLYTYIKTVFPRFGLFLVGSTMSGFGSNSSDVDMCLLVRPCLFDQRSEAINYLEQIQKALHRCDFVERPELIWAKVPILKFRDARRNLEVDLNCNNSVGIRNTHLLHCYANVDWRVRPLVLIVKMWASANNINDAKNMTISSYSLTLMVIHYLQIGVSPPVVPCLHGLYPGKFMPDSDIHNIDMAEELHPFHSDNHQNIGELLLGFLHYYSTFDYSSFAISVRLAARIPIDECRLAKSQKNDPHQWKHLCIEEPFDLTNTARSVYDPEIFERIKSVFIYSYNKLNESRDLFSIFKIDDKKL